MSRSEWNCLVLCWIYFLIFWETSILFSIDVGSVYIPTKTVWGFLSLHILTNTCCFWYCCLLLLLLFNMGQSHGSEVISFVLLICISLVITDVEYFFWPSTNLLWWSVYLESPFLIELLDFCCELYKFFMYFTHYHFQYIWFTNIFPNSVGCLSIFIIFMIVSFTVQKIFS